jgi:hypothetical protein
MVNRVLTALVHRRTVRGMGLLIVPLEATQTEATIWIGAAGDAPGPLTLDIGGAVQQPVPPAAWTVWESHGVQRLWAQRLTVTGLQPGHRYLARLLDPTTERATAVVVTLPDRLPGIAETPFICLLGSCFAHGQDLAGAAGAAYARLPMTARPDLKFLCGDQVYLDAPFPRYLTHFGDEDLKAELLATYLATWFQGGDGSGFSELLRAGASFLSSDDHEFWNNAPERGLLVRNTWFGGGRRTWWNLATQLYGTFQATSPMAQFQVGRLSFLVLDTRMSRTLDRTQLVPGPQLDAMAGWVAGLTGPGVLVVGQPMLAEQHDWRGQFLDWGLADYGQYQDMVRILGRSGHDIVILTGDVHYGRIAGCLLPSGSKLIEVIASPLALVDERAGCHWGAPPRVFPAFPIPGTTQQATWFEEGYQIIANHFATVEFADAGMRVRMTVRAWPVPDVGQAPGSTHRFQRDLD